MKKMKTLFKMDDSHQMTDIPNEDTEWVFHGPDGKFFKLRRSDFSFAWPVPQ